MKAFFVVTDDWDPRGYAVVAPVPEAAIQHIRDYMGLDDEELEVWEITDGDIAGLEEGIVDGIDGLRRGLYSWFEDTCPLCGNIRRLTKSEEIPGLICCSECEDRISNYEIV